MGAPERWGRCLSSAPGRSTPPQIAAGSAIHVLALQSHKKVAALWREAGLSWKDFLPEEDDVHTFLLEQVRGMLGLLLRGEGRSAWVEKRAGRRLWQKFQRAAGQKEPPGGESERAPLFGSGPEFPALAF